MRRDSPVICLLSFRSSYFHVLSLFSLLHLLPCLCPDLRTFDAILLDGNLCSCHIVTCLPVVIFFFRHPFTNQMHAHKTQHANIHHKTCCPSEIKNMYRTTTREILWAKAVWFVTSCCITLLLPSWRGESHPRLFGELVGRVVLRISSWFFFPPLLSRTCRIKIIRLRSTAWCNAAADQVGDKKVGVYPAKV
jgi:hypothetical protein